MKKILFGILTFLGIGLSFCSADGIYHNPSLGLISIVYNSGNNVLTLSDKNLGASSLNDVGFFYQFGNNYGFNLNLHECASISQDSIDLSSYGPGNYFNSNGTFYLDMSSSNYNIWGGVDGTFSSMQGPCPEGFHIIDNWINISNIFVDYFNFSISSSYPYIHYLFMPLGGYINKSNGCYIEQGIYGEYWASVSASVLNGSRIDFDVSSNHESWSEDKTYGMNVRCFKNESVSPTYQWNKLYGDDIPISAEISVFYNNSDDFVKVQCNGDNSIFIDGYSIVSNNNTTFTPYYNISYTDEDNQKLTESYSKSNLYLSGGLFKKTYTGDNERILTDTIESPNSSFSGYLPTFEITGGINEPTESGNIFNNFAENSVKFTLSNIPSYIQYVILLFILFFILGFIRKFRRK